MPMSVYSAIAFAKGWGAARVPVIVVSSFTLYSLILCIGATMCVL
jgi:hypothetical protein